MKPNVILIKFIINLIKAENEFNEYKLCFFQNEQVKSNLESTERPQNDQKQLDSSKIKLFQGINTN